MKTEITPEDYRDYYEAVDWDPVVFEKLLRHLGYDFGNLTLNVDALRVFSQSKTTHFVGVKEVNGSLWLDYVPVINLGSLQTVRGHLNLDYSLIESLGNLQKVGGNLNLRYTPIKHLGSLQKVGGVLSVSNTPISQKYSKQEIRQMVEVRRHINM